MPLRGILLADWQQNPAITSQMGNSCTNRTTCGLMTWTTNEPYRGYLVAKPLLPHLATGNFKEICRKSTNTKKNNRRLQNVSVKKAIASWFAHSRECTITEILPAGSLTQYIFSAGLGIEEHLRLHERRFRGQTTVFMMCLTSFVPSK